jgi:CheY-like chemotaxis protein
MTLSSMVVSRDWPEVSVLECILSSLQVGVTVHSEPQQALAKLQHTKVDAVIVDSDLPGASQFLRDLRRHPRYPQDTPLVMMGKAASNRQMNSVGALFAFDKPISVEQAVRQLSAARNLLMDGRLRYHRAGLDVRVSIRPPAGKRDRMQADLVNLSQGGVQVHSDRPLDVTRPLKISFALPGMDQEVKSQGEVVWHDNLGNVGVRFVKMAQRTQNDLRLWLARQYFAS